MKQIMGYIKPYKREVIFTILFVVLEVIVEMTLPILMADIVGKGIQSGDMVYIIKTGLFMVGLAVISILAGIGNSKFSARSAIGFAANLRKGLFEKVQTFSFKNIDSFSTASLSTRLTNDVTNIQNTVIMILRLVVRIPLMLIFSIVMAVSINGKLALILVIIMPILICALGFIIYKAMPLFGVMQSCIDKLNGNVQENLTNVRVVKSFVREEYEKAKFKKSNDSLMNTALKAMNIVILNMPVMILMMDISVVAVVWIAGNQIIGGAFDVASMTAFITYLFQILISLMMISMVFIMMTRASASYKRIVEVLKTEVDLHDNEGAVKVKNIRGDVTFENVSFKYNEEDTEYILTDINFEASAGEIVAIVGGTGAGKTSLVQLIPRLYDVSKGRILIDGKDITTFTVESLRENIGMVLQKNTLFSGTIRDNLKWGNSEATDEEMIEASKSAEAHGFIMGFPEGYDTWIDQGGVNVSGGQKQRLCIARAMLKKPKVLILDDSTSAVDTATEKKIREAFKTNLKDTTILLIAQRISSVQDADKILVVDDGKVIAIGNHEELLKTSEEYREIYYSQQDKEVTA